MSEIKPYRKCGTWDCIEPKHGKGWYCKGCTSNMKREYRLKALKTTAEIEKQDEIRRTKFFKTDVDEFEGLPLVWSDATRKEWATKYSHEIWQYKNLSMFNSSQSFILKKSRILK